MLWKSLCELFLIISFVKIVQSSSYSTLVYNELYMPYQEYFSVLRCDIFCLGNKNNEECYDNCKALPNFQTIKDASLISEPFMVCQDLKQKDLNHTYGIVVLAWTVDKTLLKTNKLLRFILEAAVIDDTQMQWHVIGSTYLTTAKIENLDMRKTYKFRLTAVVSFDKVLSPVISDAIVIHDVSLNIKPPSNVRIDFHVNNDSLDALVKWTPPKELPCSYDISLFPLTGEGYFVQKSFSQPEDVFPITISNLLYGANYTIEVIPVDPSRKRQIHSIVSYFVTPCIDAYRKEFIKGNKGTNARLCAFGPPQNLTATWSLEEPEVIIKWLPPPFVQDSGVKLEYFITIWEDDRYSSQNVFNRHIEPNKTEAIIGGIEPAKKYVIEIFAAADGISGTSAFCELAATGPLRRKDIFPEIWLYIGISLVSVAFISSIMCYIWWKRTKTQKSDIMHSFPTTKLLTGNVPTHLLPYLVPFSKIQFRELLGEGTFGIIHRGEIGSTNEKKTEVVAVKEYKSLSFEEAQFEVFREVELMQILGRHDRIAQLRGFSQSYDKRVMLLVEYCPFKDLLSWVHALRKQLGYSSQSDNYGNYLPIKASENASESVNVSISFGHHLTKLMTFMHQIADGMEYISSHKLIHCDIAARNVLMHSNESVKICDFGLARDIYESRVYVANVSRRLPIRWMAIETLSGHMFTSQSDVWSFGVLMWEMATLGDHPYSSLQNEAILPSLRNGTRLTKPRECDSNLYDVMLSCWHHKPFHRPHFIDLKKKLGLLLEERQNYLQVEI